MYVCVYIYRERELYIGRRAARRAAPSPHGLISRRGLFPRLVQMLEDIGNVHGSRRQVNRVEELSRRKQDHAKRDGGCC